MPRPSSHRESHAVDRIGWMRASILGANDGILSTASLIVGVAAAGSSKTAVLIAGTAGLVAGALSMAAGEYVSVSSQSDTEKADIARETTELATDPEAELAELTAIYVDRGLTPELASEVARQLTAGDALAAHLRDELGITETTMANPLQAALASAFTFAVGAGLPLLTVILSPYEALIPAAVTVSILALALLGGLGAVIGGARPVRGAIRVVFWGIMAMAATSLIGMIFGVSV